MTYFVSGIAFGLALPMVIIVVSLYLTDTRYR